MENFEDIKAEAEEYYQTPEYLSGVDLLRDIFAQIHGKLLAFDLDATLIEKGKARVFNGVPVLLRRPYANEILEIASGSKNRVMLWTGALPSRVERAKSIAGLVLPEDMKVVTLEDNCSVNYAKINYSSNGVRFNRDDDFDAWGNFEDGLVKVPSFFGVDLLFDDLADSHIEIGKTVMSPYRDDEKFVKVHPFDLKTMAHPSIHRKDFGLLSAAVKMAVSCGINVDSSVLDPFKKRYLDEIYLHLNWFGKMLDRVFKVFSKNL